jgi:hypothetical protein
MQSSHELRSSLPNLKIKSKYHAKIIENLIANLILYTPCSPDRTSNNGSKRGINCSRYANQLVILWLEHNKIESNKG